MSDKWAYQEPPLEDPDPPAPYVLPKNSSTLNILLNADVKAKLYKRKVWIETIEQFATWYNNQSKADLLDVKNLGEYIGVWAAKFFDEKMS